MKIIGALICCCLLSQASAQKIDRVEPPNWWLGMKNPELQLLVKGDNLADVTDVTLKDAEGVSITRVHKADSPNYLFVDLQIDENANPGNIQLQFRKGKKTLVSYNYDLRERTTIPTKGIDNSDVIYLITPDRFANGNPDNDTVKGLEDKLDLKNPNGRHGGDLEGIISRLDYMDDLGVTTLWLNPVLENAMPKYSYHGYAMTDYYKVDPRYGDNEMYRKLADELHSRDMKLIMDMVFNHSGVGHWWMKDMPFEDWVHYYPDHQITNHAMASIPDPYSADVDTKLMTDGWFVPSMPDLNHDNLFMEKYLIQNSIWWIEYAGLDGIRMDTYPYNKKETMQRWADQVLAEYPDFYLVGETWIGDVSQEAYWAPQHKDADYNSGLTSITDFPLSDAIRAVFAEGGDVRKLYDVLSKDYVYHDPNANKIFVDNHDMDRFYHQIGEDVGRFKNAMTFLMTTRGIPQIYYGSEILMRKFGEHGVLREDFPGGWKNHERDAFTEAGRTAEENEAFDHLKKLLNWRKNNKVIAGGDLKHFVPYDNVYVYSRKLGEESVVVFINNGTKDVNLNLDRYREVFEGNNTAQHVFTRAEVSLEQELTIPGNDSLIISLGKAQENN